MGIWEDFQFWGYASHSDFAFSSLGLNFIFIDLAFWVRRLLPCQSSAVTRGTFAGINALTCKFTVEIFNFFIHLLIIISIFVSFGIQKHANKVDIRVEQILMLLKFIFFQQFDIEDIQFLIKVNYPTKIQFFDIFKVLQ